MATRIFTRQVGRFRAGEIRSYGNATWQEIARSAKQKLDSFTRPVDEAARETVKSPGRKER